ncbi:MAG: sigma factor, partial [Dehalococcoidia bacterium]
MATEFPGDPSNLPLMGKRHDTEKSIRLEAMSARQQRFVEANIPLVHLTLRRCRELASVREPGREPGELVQEGCLALVEAVRSHDPARHGVFATFAMARIHYAMSRFAHEHHSLIRVPFITQRRRKQRRDHDTADRHRPEPLPRVVRMSDPRKTPSQNRTRHLYAEKLGGWWDGPTIGDLVRERYDRAVTQVVSRMKRAPRCAADISKLLDRCAQERWTVPEPEARTPIRRLAHTLGCSLGRITRCEEKFRTQVIAELATDVAYGE